MHGLFGIEECVDECDEKENSQTSAKSMKGIHI